MMHKFQYVVDLEEGYKPVMETEKVNEVKFIIEAKCRAEADRMVDAMFKADNVKEIIGVCLD